MSNKYGVLIEFLCVILLLAILMLCVAPKYINYLKRVKEVQEQIQTEQEVMEQELEEILNSIDGYTNIDTLSLEDLDL